MGQALPISSDGGSVADKEMRTNDQFSSLSPHSTARGPKSIHSLSVVRERGIKMEHGAKTIFGVLKEKLLVQNSKTLVDCFDYLKSYSTHLLSLQLHLQQIRTKFHQKTAFRLLKQNLLNKRKKQENQEIAERYLKLKS